MLRAAGLPDDSKQGLQKLRRTGVSHGEAVEPGYGAKLAGHRPGSRVTYDSYADPRIINSGKMNRLPKLNPMSEGGASGNPNVCPNRNGDRERHLPV